MSHVLSQCPDCGREWSGLSECHCVNCCRHFGGEKAFTAHLKGGECRDPSTLVFTKGPLQGQPRFVPIKRKHGFVWVAVRDNSGPGARPRQDSQDATTLAALRHHPRSYTVRLHGSGRRRAEQLRWSL